NGVRAVIRDARRCDDRCPRSYRLAHALDALHRLFFRRIVQAFDQGPAVIMQGPHPVHFVLYRVAVFCTIQIALWGHSESLNIPEAPSIDITAGNGVISRNTSV